MASAAYLSALAQASSKWCLLAEVQVRRALRGWTSEGSSTWSVPLSLYSHAATLRADRGLYLGLDGVWEGTTALTLRADVATVKANASSYFHDAATDKLYVRTSGGVNPDGLSLVQAVGTMRLSTQPPEFTDKPPYDAQIDGESLPSLLSSRSEMLRGISTYPYGDITLRNTDGFWDSLGDVLPATGWLWLNNTVRLLLGVVGMVYADYEVLASMQISAAPQVGDETARLQLLSVGSATKTAFPNHTMQDFYSFSVILGGGTPSASLPVWFGSVKEAPLVFALDNGTRNKWVSGDMFHVLPVAYSNLYAIERATGIRTALTDISTGGTDYFFLGGADRSIDIIKAWDAATYDIIADVEQASKTCGAVAQRVLIACGIPTALIDTSSFDQADLDNPAVIGLWAGVRNGDDVVTALVTGADMLDDIRRATFCDVVLSTSGLWTAKVWDPSVPTLTSVSKLTDADLLVFRPESSVTELTTTVKVQYGRSVYSDTWSETSSSRGASQAEQQVATTFTLQSLLATLADASAHAQRLSLLESRMKLRYRAEVGPVLLNAVVGDKVRVQRSRGPSSTGSFDQVLEIESISKNLASLSCEVILGNMRGLGESVKRVAPDGTPDWASASADERRQYAFVADDVTGMVDPADRTTYLQAVIW